MAKKVIITCAVTGSVHTPSMSPHLPVTPAEIAQAAIGAAEAGAAIVHLHAREPETGKPTQDPAVYAKFLPRIAQECPAVINITTGGAITMTVEERLRPATVFKPEIASLNMGSMNFVLSEMLGRYKTFQHDWEEEHLKSAERNIFRNTYSDIEHILRTCGDQGTRFEIECYDVGHLYSAAYFRDRGLLTGPIFLQTVFGIRGGIGAHYEDVLMMKRTADRLFGPNDYVWSVLGAGRNQMPIATISAALGGNVRVGLEDSLWGEPHQLAASNAEQVKKIRRILEGLSLEIATPEDARQMLQLKGSSDVGAMA